MTTDLAVTQKSRRRPSPKPFKSSNRNRHELEMSVTSFRPSKIAFLIATALERRARPANPFQLPASSLQPPESNRGRQELKIAVSPPESATSNFLIAVAGQGKEPNRDTRPSEPLRQESQVANREPGSVIDSLAIRNRRKPFALSKNPDSNRHKITSVAALSSFQPLASSFQNLIDTNAIRNTPKPFALNEKLISNRHKTGVYCVQSLASQRGQQ